LTTTGAVCIGYNDIVSEEKARLITAAHLDENPHGIAEMMRRRRNSTIGLVFVVSGSMFLILAALQF